MINFNGTILTFKNNNTIFNIKLSDSYNYIRKIITEHYEKALISLNEIAEIYKTLCFNLHTDSNIMYKKYTNIIFMNTDPDEILNDHYNRSRLKRLN